MLHIHLKRIFSCWMEYSINVNEGKFFVVFFLNLFLASLGLHCYAWAFSSCGEQGLLFVAVRGLLIVVASLVVEQGL